MNLEKSDVIIIGAGPVGLVSAISLAKAGISCVVVERRPTPMTAPKAHAINPRTLEICQRIGVCADQLVAQAASPDDAGLVHFMDVLNGTCFGNMPYERQDEAAKQFVPWPLVNIAQPNFENQLNEVAAKCDNLVIMRGVTASGLVQDDEKVTVQLHGARTGTCAARYVIAADGASSKI